MNSAFILVRRSRGATKLTQRLKTIDAMRGIAAMWVVAFHLSINLNSELQFFFPDIVNVIFAHGYLGVPVFFVVSGFVISLSIGNTRIDRSYSLNFFVKRSIRLTPAYWASIVFSFGLLVLQNRLLSKTTPFPTGWGLLAHLFYLQDLLSIEPQISVVYWTLCVEVQLYTFFLGSIWFCQRFGGLIGKPPRLLHLALILIVGVYSIALDQGLLAKPMPGLFLSYWHYFLMGVILSHAYRNLPGSHFLLVFWFLIETVCQVFIGIRPFTLAGGAFSLILFCHWKYGFLKNRFDGKILQYLGAISYTLYLVHPEIGWKVISFGKYLLKHSLTPELAGVLFAAGIAASVFTAHVFHFCVEKPSLILNSKLKLSGFSGRTNYETKK